MICGSGLGVMYTANRFPRVRAALVHDVPSAALARRHNDANVLALSGDRSDADTAWLIVRTWLETPFEGGRHASRIAKIDALTRTREDVLEGLAAADPELRRLLRREARREARELDLRPVANYVSDAVLGVLGSLLAQRSAAFGTSPLASEAESLARERALALFGAAGAEVRVPSLGQARRLLAPRAAQRALFVGAELADPAGSGRLDVAAVEARARAERPDVLVVEAEEFVRAVDFAALRGVADALGARLAVDLGGLAGLVAGGALPSPTPHADLVWAATDRTLRGPRGALVLFRAEHAGEIAEVLGRPLSMRPGAHEVAALAVALREATAPDFRDYAARACDNAARPRGGTRRARASGPLGRHRHAHRAPRPLGGGARRGPDAPGPRGPARRAAPGRTARPRRARARDGSRHHARPRRVRAPRGGGDRRRSAGVAGRRRRGGARPRRRGLPALPAPRGALERRRLTCAAPTAVRPRVG